MNEFFRLAVSNVARLGDTDIFPFPIENHIFYDEPERIVKILHHIHNNFDAELAENPPINLSALSPVGYTGFRWATQVDPIWNAYFLALVISLGDRIEECRLPIDVVFSYRFHPNTERGMLFDPTVGWNEFQERSLGYSREYPHVLICDIADFYSRVYHHRLENSLLQLNDKGDGHRRIMSLLSSFSDSSYGLPVGGPAARLLSELLLNRTDRLLRTEEIPFCRFSDDYHIFAHSQEEAYQHLVFLSEKLFQNEGLSLQKAKTRILTSSEFRKTSELMNPDHDDDNGQHELFRLPLRFDPYSATAEEDYEALKERVRRIDIFGMLGRELSKSRIHTPTTRRLIRAIRYLEQKPKDQAILSLMENLPLLSPVFGTVMIVVRDTFDDLSDEAQKEVCAGIMSLIREGSHLIRVGINMAFAIRVLCRRRSEESEVLLAQLYRDAKSELVQRDIILIMAKWQVHYWISDARNHYNQMRPWQRRAFIIASYCLRDEGMHWRRRAQHGFSPFESLLRDWTAKRFAGASIANLPV